MNGSNDRALEEAYLVLSDLRYLLHREVNTWEDYRKIAQDYSTRIAESADAIREMLPEEVVAKHDEP